MIRSNRLSEYGFIAMQEVAQPGTETAHLADWRDYAPKKKRP